MKKAVLVFVLLTVGVGPAYGRQIDREPKPRAAAPPAQETWRPFLERLAEFLGLGDRDFRERERVDRGAARRPAHRCIGNV